MHDGTDQRGQRPKGKSSTRGTLSNHHEANIFKEYGSKEYDFAENGVDASRIIFFVSAAISFVLFVGLVFFSPTVLIYDEPLHMEGARLLAGGAGLRQLLLMPVPSAAGPLFPVIHALLAPLTHLNAPAVRWVNVTFLLWTMGATFLVACQTRRHDSLAIACLLLAVPMTWPTGGMALTEMPAAAMASSAVCVLIFAQSTCARSWALSIPTFAVSGVFVGLAVVGRQIYLPLILAYLGAALVDKRLLVPAMAALACACAVFGPVFIIWGGILAPSKLYHGGSIAISHGTLSFAYLGAIVMILTPTFYARRASANGMIFAIGFLLNMVAFDVQMLPFKSILALLPGGSGAVTGRIFGSVLVGTACAFAIAMAITVWEHRNDYWSCVLAFMAIVLAATPFAIVHLFSSRYAFAAVPFLLPLLAPYFVMSRWAAARLLLGTALGALSLYSYFWPPLA